MFRILRQEMAEMAEMATALVERQSRRRRTVGRPSRVGVLRGKRSRGRDTRIVGRFIRSGCRQRQRASPNVKDAEAVMRTTWRPRGKAAHKAARSAASVDGG